MNTILRTGIFDAWLTKLKDMRGKARILKRIRSAERGHFGDIESLGAGVWEMRIHIGPGYRFYFTRQAYGVYVLLCGGSKRGQQRDISRAQKLARNLKEV